MKKLTGTRYPWAVLVEGDDLVVRGEEATWFGGSNDPMDDGRTASGVSTKANPHLLGCSLPMDLGPLAKHNPCEGSPLPKLSWFTKVLVTNRDTATSVTVQLIDLGPSAPPVATAAIDLTQAAFVALGGDLKAGRLPVDFRIVGAAKTLGIAESKPEQPTGSGLTITPNFGAGIEIPDQAVS